MFEPALLLFNAPPEAARIPLAMLTMFGTAKLLAELFERFGQPGIVGEILAGVLIGPSVLGWVAPNPFLTSLADIGVMFLLFRVGLEVNPKELLKLGGTATIVAICGVIVPFILGWAILSAWGYPRIEAIFVGAAMVATSVGITAQVLSAQGLLQERASKIILAAAVIDDVLGLLVLAIVSSMAKGEVNALEITLTVGLAVAFVVAIALWGNHTMGKLVPKLNQTMQVSEAEFSLAMILLFTLSVAAVYVGVAAIVGAFFAGMALAGKIRKQNYRVVVITGDGEINEGSVWEGAYFAAHYELDNLVAVVDRNGLSIMGKTEELLSIGSLEDKFRSFGWEAVTVDGHSYEELLGAYSRQGKTEGKPLAIIANTVKGKGISFMEDRSEWHNRMPDVAQQQQAWKDLETNCIAH